MIRSLSFAVLGAVAWSASEYAIHRFLGHGPKRSEPKGLLGRLSPRGLAYEFNREHLAHHSDPTYFAPTSHKVAAAGIAISSVTAALAPFVGLRGAGAFALGFTAAYGSYELLHRRIHTHPATGPYGRWARRHHLAHHYRTPRENHGVTSDVWDRVFRTRLPVEQLRVPRRSAPVWMTDARGALHSELAEDYRLVGKEAAADSAPDAVTAS